MCGMILCPSMILCPTCDRSLCPIVEHWFVCDRIWHRYSWTLIRVWQDLILLFPFQMTNRVWLQMGGSIKQLDDLNNVVHESRVIYFQFLTDILCLVLWPLCIWDISYCDNLLYFIDFLNLLSSQFDHQRHMKWQIVLRWDLIPV